MTTRNTEVPNAMITRSRNATPQNAMLLLGAFLACASLTASAGDCPASRGEEIFQKCTACHSRQAGKHLMGPSLHGLSGRPAGQIEGFLFSNALRDSAVVWSGATLDEFLKNPQAFIPGTVMPFGGIQNDSDRAALVCYLLAE